MDLYHIALFVHLVTLIAAAGASAVMKLAAARRARARTVGEMLEWHGVMASTAGTFPLCLVLFVASGAYMLSFGTAAAWSSGLAVAGLTGVAFLLVSSTFLGIKAKGLKQMLEAMAERGADTPAPRLSPPPIVAALPMVNTGIVLGVVFDMVAKPASVSLALGALALGMVLCGAVALYRRPMPAVERARSTQAAS